MNRPLAVAVALLAYLSSGNLLAAERPNVIVILIDDLGWMDVAFQGNRLVETPNLDRFVTQGMRFTDAYAAAPVCSPTRAAILTGQAPARLRITNHIANADFTPKNAAWLPAAMRNELPLESVTIAEHFKSAGYRTGFIGKYHLAGLGKGNPKLYPDHQGFDVNIGGCGFGGPPTFFDPYRIPTIANRRKGEYLPDRLADESDQFITQAVKSNQPFMLMLWNYTVHWPMEAPAKLIEKYRSRTGPGLNDTRYGAMIEAMDQAFGRLMSTLDRLKISDNTLVVFTSDNGGFSGVADNRPLRAGKGYLYEGGIRVPMVVRWPGRIRPGSTSKVPVISTDLFPTLMDVAQIPLPKSTPCDGVSLIPLLTKEKKPTRDSIYFHFPNYAWHKSNRLGGAIRSGRYKLIEWYDDRSVELYDLEADLSEKTDLAKAKPQIANELVGKLRAWRRQTNAAMPTRSDKK